MNEQDFLNAMRKIVSEEIAPIKTDIQKLREEAKGLQEEIVKINITLEHEVRDQLNLLRENQTQIKEDIKTLNGVKEFAIEASMKASGAGFAATTALETAKKNQSRIEALEQKAGV